MHPVLSVRNLRISGVSPLLIAALVSVALLHTLSAMLFINSSADGQAVGWNRLPLDQAWARLVYVRSFAESFTFQFNNGVAETGATSPLWVMLNGLLIRIFSLSPEATPALAKVLGICFGITTAWMTGLVTWQITRRRSFGLLAAAVLAVEPHFVFAAVSGMEVTLFAAISLATTWSFLRGRTRTAGILAALAIIARPEGLLLAGLIIGTTFARWIWRREGGIFQHERDVRDVTFIAFPAAVITIAWVVYNWLVAGGALPSTYLVRNQQIGLLPLSNLWNIWLGYMHELPFMDGLAWVAGLPLITLGTLGIIRRYSFSGAPIALFGAAMVYATMVGYERPSTEWEFADRRHLDATIPFIVILLAAGWAWSWKLIWRWHDSRRPLSEKERKSILITARVAAAAVVIATLAALPVKWDMLTTDYAWNSRNIDEVSADMGRWLAANTPEDAVIGAVPAGAIRYHSDRNVIDLSGLNSHEATGKPALDYGLQQGVDYMVAFREPYFDSIPGRSVVYESVVSVNSMLPANVMRAYGPAGSAQSADASRTSFTSFVPVGLELIDMFDPGNASADRSLSEATHDYGLEGNPSAVAQTLATESGAILSDDARVFTGAEEFTAGSVPRQPLTVVKRYDASIGGELRVFADGELAGTWELPIQQTFFGESSFTIPANLITNARTRLRFEVIPTRLAIAGNSFFYWILVPAGTAP